MYLVFSLQVCFVLVSSSPLYDFNYCSNTYPGYGNDPPFVVQRSNYNPYALDLLIQNRLNPLINSQSSPHQYQYLNTNNFVPNYQLYNQNGLDLLHVPETETEKVVNNYILIPEEYLHSDAIEKERDKKFGAEISKINRKSKRRRPVGAKLNNGNADVSNQETKTTRSKGLRGETERAKNGRKKTKKEKSNTNKSNQLTTNVEEALPLKKVKTNEEAIIKKSNNHFTSSGGKDLIEKNKSSSNNPKHHEPKTTKGLLQERKEGNKKETKKEVVNDFIPDGKTKSRKKDDTGFADVNVCFDINEDCTDLVCRHTRNKDLNKKIKPQSLKPQPDLPNNLNNYMNGLTFNQQMNPNVFNPNVNFPFNFDYLYQIPQTSNVNPKEANNRRRSRKRKQPPSNRQTISNKKNKNSVTTINSCDKVVELNPEIPKAETTTLPTKTTTKATTHTEEPEPESKNNFQVEIALETDEDPNLDIPTKMYTETLFTEDLDNDEISNNNNVPFGNYNDVMDEYYPDFTLDNIYMTSKEDYDLGNFHDRHYYTYGDKPELNRERRKYEHPNENKLNGPRKYSMRNEKKNIMQEPSQIQEILYKTDASKEKVNVVISPALQFPGFKTEMINKKKYFAEEEHGSNNFDINGISTNKMYPSSRQVDGIKNQNYDNVEMVFANSKVVRYGVPEKKEVLAKVPEPEVKKEFKNLISTDGKTTIVIAKSLGYS